MPVGNVDFDQIAATTLQEYTNSLVNNIFEEQVFMFLMSQGTGDRSGLRFWNGGRSMVQPLIYGKNTTVGTYRGYDTLNTTPQDGISAAEFPVRQMAGTVTIDGYSTAVNSGPQEVVDLLEAKMMQLRESFVEEINRQMVLSDGTGNTNKDWMGLALLVGNDTRSPVCGGIDAADPLNPWWRSGIVAHNAALTLQILRTTFNNVSNGSDQPDFALTTQTLHERYEGLLQPQQQFRDEQVANAGFTNLLYKDRPVVYDDFVPTGEWYWINKRYMKLRPHQSTWMRAGQFIEPPSQDARVAKVLAYGNMVISNRARQGLITGLT